MDLQGALQQLQAHVRTQVEIVLTNLARVATREHFDEAIYNRFLSARQVIPLIYGQMLEWSNQLNNMAFAQGLQGLADALNSITLEVDAALQQGVDDARRQRFIQGVTNADSVMSTFLQNNYATIVQFHNTHAAASSTPAAEEPPPPAPADDMPPPPPPEDDSPFDAPIIETSTPNNTPVAQAQAQPAPFSPNPALVTLPSIGTPPTPSPISTATAPTSINPTVTGSSAAPPTTAPGNLSVQNPNNPSLNRSPSSMLPRVSWAAPLNDLISTEQEYIQLVTNAANAYESGFKSSVSRMKKALSEADITSIQSLFSGLGLIAKCHSQFLPHIEAARAGTEPLGGAIKTMVITLKVYTNYMTDLDAKIEVLRKSRKSKEFSKFLDECKAKNGSHQEIESICAQTYKRLGTYEGLINAFLVNMTPSDPDYNEVKESQQLVRKVVEYIAQARSDLDSRNKIIVIQQRVGSLPSNLNLVAPHRVLLREQDLDVRSHDAKKAKDMHVYAFNDMILLTRTKGLVSKEEVCESIISYHDYRIELANENDRAAFKMVDSKKGGGFVFSPPDEASRASWVADIKSAMEQLKNSRATTLVDQVDENELQTKLQVRVIAGRDVIQSLYDPPDLFVQVSLSSSSNPRKSAVRDKCRFNPDWEDKFVLPVKNPYEDTLSVEVKEVNGDTILAQTSIALDDLYDHVEKLGWFKLSSNMANQSLQPEVLLGLMVAPTLVE